MFYVYFLRSQKNGRYYTGMTGQHPSERLKEHNCGTNKWTRYNGPFLLIYFETYHCKEDATAREAFYKTGIGRKIRNIILSAVSAKNGLAFNEE